MSGAKLYDRINKNNNGLHIDGSQDNTKDFEKDMLKENPQKVSYLWRLFKYVFSSAKTMCCVYLGLAIVLSLIQPLLAFVWGRYIDTADIMSHTKNTTVHAVFSLIGLAIFYWFLSYLSELLNRYIYGGEDIERLSKVQDHRLQEKFHVKLYQKIAKLYPEYYEVPRINDMISRNFNLMGGEWSSLQRGVMIEGYVIIAKVISVAMVAVSMYIFHPALCFLVLLAPIPTLYTTYVGNKLNFKFSRDNDQILRKAGYYQSVLLGGSIKEVKVMNLFNFFFSKWKKLIDDYVIREKKNQLIVFSLGAISSVIANVSNVIAYVVAIVLMTQGKLSVGALGAVLVLIETLMGSMTQLLGSIANFVSKKNEAAQFFELIDLKEQDSQNNGAHPHMITIDVLQMCDISYRYPLTDVLRIANVNFEIKKGEKVAFVGENGAGKSTFVNLIAGLLKPTSGEIYINEDKVEETDYGDRYNSTSYMFQEPARFNTFTVSENVLLGDILKNGNEVETNRALAFAGLDDVNGNEMLGKEIGGKELSGGQWQKISIARAYYRDRDFIILDEPTSNLDPLAEAEIFKKYMTMTSGKTVIIVTHRVSMASIADRVVVFKDGRIVEDGKQEELLNKNGEYARLFYAQSQWYDR